MITNMKPGLLVLVPLVLAMSLLATSEAHAAASSGLLPPSIAVSDAVGTNPGTVYTAAQTQRTVNVSYNAGSDYPYCEVYYTVNSANQTELGRNHDGTKPLTVKAGSTYAFWMIVYLGSQGQEVKTVTELVVVAKQGGPPATIPPPQSGGGSSGGSSDRSTDPLARVGKGKAGALNEFLNSPFINDVRVQPDARNVVISFASTQSTPPLIEIGKVAPAPDRFGVMAFPFNSGAFSRFATEQKGRYTLDVDSQQEQLEIGTTYYYIINVFNNNKNDTRRPREQITGTFNTLPQTVKVVWEKILMEDDSDDLSSGDCQFWFWANFGQPSAKDTYDYYEDMDSGHNYYFNRTMVIDNAPDKLKLEASGREFDGTQLRIMGNEPLSGPGKHGDDSNAAKGEYDLSQYPGNNVTVPFTLRSMPHGNLRFVVYGHLEITRGDGERIGTSSSALKTAPAPGTVRVGARVRPTEGTAPRPPISKCESAQIARARNSPAAPGLTAQCLAIVSALAARGEAIANLDPSAIALRNQQPIGPARRGFNIGMAAAEGHTLPGPGKQSIHDSLSPAEQAGFNAAVSFSLERNKNLERNGNADLDAKGVAIANQDPLAVELRKQQRDDSARRGFDIGMSAAEGHTLPGPGKQRIHDSLDPAERAGFATAVSFSLERNRNKELATKGAAITQADPTVAAARNAESDVFYRLGFDIATGIFGDPALGAQGNTATGPGSLGIRDALSAAAQRGFNAAVTFHLSRNYKR